MSPTYSRKAGLRYRHYVSRALVEGRSKDAGAMPRVSAELVEMRVIGALQSLPNTEVPEDIGSLDNRTAIRDLVDHIVLSKTYLTILLSVAAAKSSGQPAVEVAWECKRGRPKRVVLPPKTDMMADGRPIRFETRATLLRALAQGRLWLNELVTGKVPDTDVIAAREGRSKRSIHMTMSLAFVAPDIIEAAVAGRLPRGIDIMRLIDLPPDWAMQRRRLGLAPRLES